MHLSLLLTGMLLGQAGLESRPAVKASPDKLMLTHCLISLSEESKVSAKEPGQLVKLSVRDGDPVSRGQILAQLDDEQRQMEYKSAEAKFRKADEEAHNTVNKRYSEAVLAVVEAQLQTYIEANSRVPGSVTRAQLRESTLQVNKSKLEVEQALFKMKTDALEADARRVEMEAALEGIERRKVKSFLDGVVVDLKYHEGEWVQAGETIMRVLRLDRLRIEGYLKAEDYSAAELNKRPVKVTVALAHGRQETFAGMVTFVSPQIEASGEFRVRVDVLNKKENDFWLLLPGQNAEMAINLVDAK